MFKLEIGSFNMLRTHNKDIDVLVYTQNSISKYYLPAT